MNARRRFAPGHGNVGDFIWNGVGVATETVRGRESRKNDRLVSGERSKPRYRTVWSDQQAGVAAADRPWAITRRNEQPPRPVQPAPRGLRAGKRGHSPLRLASSRPWSGRGFGSSRGGAQDASRCVARYPDFPHHPFTLSSNGRRAGALGRLAAAKRTGHGGLPIPTWEAWGRACVADCVAVIDIGICGRGGGRRGRRSRSRVLASGADRHAGRRRIPARSPRRHRRGPDPGRRPPQARGAEPALLERWRSARRICENMRRRDAADCVRRRRRRFVRHAQRGGAARNINAIESSISALIEPMRRPEEGQP